MDMASRMKTVAAILALGGGMAQAAEFKPCDDAASHPALSGTLCAREQAPLEYANSGAGAPAAAVTLFVRKFPAAEPVRGQVWLVAGGPGESGASFYGILPRLRQAFPGFDLLMPDHRGTGFSTRMCPLEEAVDSPGGAALAGAEWGSCFQHLNRHPETARRFTQTDAAHDLKLLLERTPHSGKTYLYGVSYGTQLVLRSVALGLPRVDGLVLDSLVPLQDDATADLSRRSLVVDRVGRAILADCDRSRACSARMGEPVEQIYRRVLARAEREPELLDVVPGRNLKRFFGSLLDFPLAANEITAMIKELDAGKTTILERLVAEVKQEMAVFGAFPQSPPSHPLAILISGAENNLQPGRSAEDVAREEQGLLFASSLSGLLVSKPFPVYERDAWFGRLPGRLPPTLVLHGKRDGKTPYEAALRHIAALRKAGNVALYETDDGGHFMLWSDRACLVNEVRRFVLGDEESARCVKFTMSH